MINTQEAHLIGAILLDGTVMDEVAGTLEPAHFTDAATRRIYTIALSLWKGGTAVDPVVVAGQLDDSDQDIMEELVAGSIGSANAKAYADAIQESYRKRQVGAACRQTVEELASPEADVQAATERLLERLHSLNGRGGGVTIGCCDGIAETWREVEQRAKDGGGVPGIPTPFSALDQLIGGWEDGLMYVLGARASIGKSALASQCVSKAANIGLKPMLVGLEGTDKQFYRRLLGRESGVPPMAQRKGDLTPAQWDSYTKASREVAQWADNVTVLFRPGITPTAILAEAMRVQRIHGLDLLVVDYLQLMRTGNQRASIYETVTECSHALTEIAMRLSVPVLALSQLNRDMEKVGGGRATATAAEMAIGDSPEMREPTLVDLRNSGDVEQDAACVLLLHRPHRNSDEAKLICAKQRDGEAGVALRLSFDGPRMTFKEAY